MERETHESVLNERERVVGDLGNELDALRLGSVVDAALENAAAVTVGPAISQPRQLPALNVPKRRKTATHATSMQCVATAL